MRSSTFFLCALAVSAVVFGLSRLISSEYYFFAGYVVLQYIVLATAWNILGGYTGYVNFGSAAFFALGAYSSVFIHKTFPLPIPVLIVIGGVVSGIVGLGMGYLTLRLRGAFFAIATLALAVVVQTLITNWDYVGGSRGAYILRPATAPLVGSSVRTIIATWRLSAAPVPTTVRFTVLEAYSVTVRPACAAASSTTPRAWPSLSEEPALRLTTVSSTAATLGQWQLTTSFRPR